MSVIYIHQSLLNTVNTCVNEEFRSPLDTSCKAWGSLSLNNLVGGLSGLTKSWYTDSHTITWTGYRINQPREEVPGAESRGTTAQTPSCFLPGGGGQHSLSPSVMADSVRPVLPTREAPTNLGVQSCNCSLII